MYRRMKSHIKTGIIILIFSLLVTTVFTTALFWYGKQVSQIKNGAENLYYLSPTAYPKIIESGGTLQVDSNQLIKTTDYNSHLLNQQLAQLLPVSLMFLTSLFILSVGLWSLLKQIQKKQVMKIASQLNNITTDNMISDEPFLSTAYQALKQKFDNQLNDYKRLSAYLSHEQKNTIAILRTKLELSKSTEHLKTLDSITDSIDDILTLSENMDTSPMVNVDVSLVCAEVYDNYRKVASNISFDYDGQEDTEIKARNRWVYRAIANLLDNAIKYGEGKPILLSVKAKNNSVIIMVKDQGIGIDEAKQETIFNNHYRINELNKDGYGIGLSLVSHVCDLCSGFVSVESKIGSGSTFYLSFPQELSN